MFIGPRGHRGRTHGSQQVGRLYCSGFKILHIDGVNAVDEFSVAFIHHIEVRTKPAVNKWVDQISKPDKYFKMKVTRQQGQYVLCANALETVGRAIKVFIWI